jgi:hypothetical protein
MSSPARTSGFLSRPLAGTGMSVSMVLAVLAHPSLWPTAVRQVALLAPSGWWRRAPYVPLPDPAYLRFRMVTAYGGDGDRGAEPEDLLTYLRWCRAWPGVTARR